VSEKAIEEIKPAQIYRVINENLYSLQIGTYVVVLSMQHDYEMKQDIWKIANFWIVGSSWLGAKETVLTEDEIYSLKFISSMQDLILLN